MQVYRFGRLIPINDVTIEDLRDIRTLVINDGTPWPKRLQDDLTRMPERIMQNLTGPAVLKA